ncbi:hypothetical protein P3T76_013229 [Phytophthora citrophthora]|uniref:HAT C-terminal dimerisation domain-containing protein n=1 Tax=Phytophthora citrophthora TaxID=4793 RepID=A0AAD9G442_9STRA|nr:hypothetical protein P3T76_013229 [Phytophthora citrophthora]
MQQQFRAVYYPTSAASGDNSQRHFAKVLRENDRWVDGRFDAQYWRHCDFGIYREVQLGCSPPLNEQHYTADERYNLVKFVLAIYGKSITSPSVLMGDNCSTNKVLADRMGIPLVGCGCHKLNLAVKPFLGRRDAVEQSIACVDAVITQLRNIKAAGSLRALTPLAPIKRNVTRWSSTHSMLNRYLKIEKELKQIDDVDTIRRTDLEHIKDILSSMDNFKDVTTDLQRKGEHIGSVHDMFQIMLEDYPEMKDYLAVDTAISPKPLFESAVVKIINGKHDSLTAAEKNLVKKFLVKPTETEVAPARSDEKRIYASALRERKRQKPTHPDEYADLRFIAGTSASVERLFSSAKHVLSSTRKRLTPVNFEKILFIKQNRFLWNAQMVAKAMKTCEHDQEVV